MAEFEAELPAGFVFDGGERRFPGAGVGVGRTASGGRRREEPMGCDKGDGGCRTESLYRAGGCGFPRSGPCFEP